MLDFKNFKITTDGEKFRIECLIKPIDVPERWIPMSREGYYYGCESFGFVNVGERIFDTKQQAIDYIRTEWGESGIRKIIKEWGPC
jgi:hypothetical protein